jgi:hypothetical protein
MFIPSYTSSNQGISFFNSGNNQNIPFLYLQDNKLMPFSYSDRISTSNTYQKAGSSQFFVQNNYLFVLPPQLINVSGNHYNKDFDSSILDATERYKELYHVLDVDVSRANSFLASLRSLSQKHNFQPYIIFTQFGAKAEFDFNNKHFVFDYEYDDPDSIVLLCNWAGELNTKECSLNELESAFEAF